MSFLGDWVDLAIYKMYVIHSPNSFVTAAFTLVYLLQEGVMLATKLS